MNFSPERKSLSPTAQKSIVFGTILLVSVLLVLTLWSRFDTGGKHRVIVSTDIGGSDPDDFQSMVHYLVYADMFDTEGLISSPPHGGRLRDILECIAAYAEDYDNLSTWSPEYPSPEALRSVSRQGAIRPQAAATPSATISAGAELIIRRAEVEDRRPLYLLVWGSMTDVAQAVHKRPDIKSKLRIISIGSWNTRYDTGARDYLFDHHPDLWWIESDTTFRGVYMGGDQEGAFANERFTQKHVERHGSLGALFMRKKADIKMGDTGSVLYLLNGDADDPEAEHWGGAYVRPYAHIRPTYWHDNPETSLAYGPMKGAVTVSKWRREFLSDWMRRMDRTVSKKPAE